VTMTIDIMTTTIDQEGPTEVVVAQEETGETEDVLQDIEM